MRIAGRLPLALWLVIVFASIASVWMILVTLDRPAPGQWAFRGFEAVLALSFGSVGALVAARRPENRIGWLLLATSVLTAIQGFVDQYPVLAGAGSSSLPYADAARWTAAWIWAPGSIGMFMMPMIFPDGRLPSPRWRLVALLGLVAIAVQVGLVIAVSQPVGPVPPSADPAPYFALNPGLFGVGYALQFCAIALATLAALLRFRRAGGVERQQMKWIFGAGLLLPFAAAAAFSGIPFGQIALIAVAFIAAIAIATSILRYRLYEIDVIINRTLVYGVLTAVLAGVYTASITLSQRVFVAVTGDRSDAAIVITTLLVAATFTPLKTRLQAIVDKRVKPLPVTGVGVAAVPASTAGGEALELLARLARLRWQGVVTQGEFEVKKTELLGRL